MSFKVLISAFTLGLLALAVGLRAAQTLPHETRPVDNLVVAGQPSLDQLERLAGEGFTTVINLRRPGEFDDFDEAAEVARLGMDYVHIPLKNVESIDDSDVNAVHQAISNASGSVLLHCTVGWRAAGLLAIERYRLHGASADEAMEIAAEAHMSHASGDVEDWIEARQ